MAPFPVMRIACLLAVTLVSACKMKGAEDKRKDEPVTAPSTGKGDPGAGGGEGSGFDRGLDIGLDGDFEVVGAIDKLTVRRVVKDNATRLQTCYEQTLMANPEIAGTVTATFTIDNGSVTNVKASGVHPDVEICVIKAVQLFRFPPGGRVEVSYPFTFKPAS